MSKTLSSLAQYFSIILSILFILFLSACKKDKPFESIDKFNTENSFLENAKNYFYSSVLYLDEKRYSKMKEKEFSLSEIEQYLQWEKPIIFKDKNSNFLFVPLNEQLKSLNKESIKYFSYLIFQQGHTGSIINMSIIEVLSDTNHSLDSNLRKIILMSVKYKYLSISESVDSVNASIIFYNQNYLRDTSFQLQNGSITPLRISFRKDLKITRSLP